MQTNADTILDELLGGGLTLQDLMDAAERRAGPVDATAPLPGAAGHSPGFGADGRSGEGRYEDLGLLGMGGVGAVSRVHDHRLGRVVARKSLRAEVQARPPAVARFIEEAQATAQLQHPGIIPIYDAGLHPDGRPWFTMKEVSGRTLGEVIREVHAASRESWGEAPSGWSLRRLVDALARVADALAYAHARGVVHRDLKPANVMVGEHGEVLVLDWGIAKVMGRAAATPVFGDGDAPVQTGRSVEASHPTMVGAVAGTPAYMAPEQAFGDIAHISPATDVYALGAMLREVLSGRPPYTGETAMDILAQVRAGPPAPLGAGEGPLPSWDDARSTAEEDGGGPVGPSLPAPLVALCARAMARAPEARVPGAAAMAAELRAWLDGARRREDALALVAAAAEQGPEAAALRARAAALRATASAALAAVQPWRPESDKAAGWALEDEALGLERAAERASIREEQLLQGALTHAPDGRLVRGRRVPHRRSGGCRRRPARRPGLLPRHPRWLLALRGTQPPRRGAQQQLRPP